MLRTQVFPEVYRDARRGASCRRPKPPARDHSTVTWIFSPILGALPLMLDPVVRFFARIRERHPSGAHLPVHGCGRGSRQSRHARRGRRKSAMAVAALAAGAFVLNLLLAVAALAGGLGLEGLAAAMLVGRTVYAAWIVVAAARGSGLTDGRPSSRGCFCRWCGAPAWRRSRPPDTCRGAGYGHRAGRLWAGPVAAAAVRARRAAGVSSIHGSPGGPSVAPPPTVPPRRGGAPRGCR